MISAFSQITQLKSWHLAHDWGFQCSHAFTFHFNITYNLGMLAKNFYDFAPHCTSCPRLPTIHVEVFISLRGERNLRDTSCFCCPQGAHGNNGRFQPTGGCAVEIDCWHVRHAYSDLLFQYMFIIVYPRGGSVFVDANGFQGLMYGSMT